MRRSEALLWACLSVIIVCVATVLIVSVFAPPDLPEQHRVCVLNSDGAIEEYHTTQLIVPNEIPCPTIDDG